MRDKLKKKARKKTDARYRRKRDEIIAQGVAAGPVTVGQIETGDLTQVFKVIYLCAHQNRFVEPKPIPGDILWCYRCCDYQRVVKVDQSVLRRRINIIP